MPLYSELGYYSSSPLVYSPSRSPASTSPYSPFSRLNPYTPPPPRSIYSKDGQYKPMLTSISETPSSIRLSPLTSLTRINSGKHYSFLRPTSYVSPRPIQMNTADIDVSASRFRKNRNVRIRSTSPEIVKNESETSTENVTSNSSSFMPRVDQNDPVPCTTIKRDRNIVRLSTMRQRSHSRSNRSSHGSKKSTGSKKSSPKSISSNGSSSGSTKNRNIDSLSDEPCDGSASNIVKKSWRDKFGESLQTNTQKVVRKTPGELILERHLIRERENDKENTLKIPSMPKTTMVHIPDNVTPQEITYLEPLIRKSIRRQSLVSCPNFKDICKDISSDLKAEDDLNAGDLRRRASLILEQEAHILAQITAMRRPSAEIVVDETIQEEEPSPEEESQIKDVEEKTDTEKITEHEAVVTKLPTLTTSAVEPQASVENVIVIKKKTKKKGGKLKHKITVTVEIDNPITLKSDTQSDTIGDDKQTDITTTLPSQSKKSPTWRAVVEEIQEDVVLNLPKKTQDNTNTEKQRQKQQYPQPSPLQKTESQDFWHLLGRRESIYFKKKVDLKRNEIEIIEIIGPDDEKSTQDENETNTTQPAAASIEAKINSSKAIDDEAKTDIIAKKTKPVQLKINTTNNVKPKVNLNNDKKAAVVDSVKTIKETDIEKEKEKEKENEKEKEKEKGKEKEKEKEMEIENVEKNEKTNESSAINAPTSIPNDNKNEIKPSDSNENIVAAPMESKSIERIVDEQLNDKNNESAKALAAATSNETAHHQHKQTDKSNAKSPMVMQTSNLKIGNGLTANKTEPEVLKQYTSESASTSTTTTTTPQDCKPLEKLSNTTLTTTTVEIPISETTSTSKVNETNNLAATVAENDTIKNASEKPKVKKVVKKTVKNAEPKKLKSDRKLEGKTNENDNETMINTTEQSSCEPNKADANDNAKTILSHEKIDEKPNDNANESESSNVPNVVEKLSDALQNDEREKCFLNSTLERSNDDNSFGGGLTKFPTVANLNTDLSKIDDKQQNKQNERRGFESFELSYRNNHNNLPFSMCSIISGVESIDFRLDSANGSDDSDRYSSDESDVGLNAEKRRKKRKERFDAKKAMKLDPKRKCYVMEEAPKYPLIATPRPLAKRSNYCATYDDSDSDSDETSSDLSSSDECYDECLSPNDVVVKDVIRMSTCSNDSGFEGGGTAPLSPKKMLGKQHK